MLTFRQPMDTTADKKSELARECAHLYLKLTEAETELGSYRRPVEAPTELQEMFSRGWASATTYHRIEACRDALRSLCHELTGLSPREIAQEVAL